MAATWNTSMARSFGEVVAYETRASGIPWNFSPVLDLGRQPLWSRHFETLGEDPLLAAELGTAIVEGYQGKEMDAFHVAACLKHFVGYSAPFSGRDRTPAWIPEKYMQELYLPTFKKAVDAGAMTLMINSGVVNGIPGHANHHLLTKVLKDDWGFKGFTVSDWEDFIMLHTVHAVSKDLYEAVILAFNAGVDMSMVPLSPQYKEYCKFMKKALQEKRISMERLDDAVRRILRVKMHLGLFELDNNKTNYPEFASEEFKKMSRDAALESITLLKNEDALPLSMKDKVLVAGPTSNDLIYLNGAWSHTWQGDNPSFNTKNCHSIYSFFEQKLGKDNCLFSQGAKLIKHKEFETSQLLDINDFKEKASQSDVILLCLGEAPSTEKPGDIKSLNLDAAQLELANIAYATGKKVVLILVEGRPRIIRPIVEGADAIVQTYLPGDYGAEALFQLMYGIENFSGKLPYTYPKYDGVIEFYDHPKSVARAKSNGFTAYDPQWNFGFGLSYSNIQYSNLKVSSNTISRSDSLSISVTVTNESDLAAKEVVQLYIGDDYASYTPAMKKLKAFKKINLKGNSSQTVTFKISTDSLKFSDTHGNWVTEDGMFTIFIDKLNAKFELK